MGNLETKIRPLGDCSTVFKIRQTKKIYWSKLAKNNLKIKIHKNIIQQNSKSE